jgi:hypothetical protein
MGVENWLKNFTKKQIKEGRIKYIDTNAADSMSLPEFMYKEYGKKRNQGGVTLDFEEANVRDSMFTGGAAIRGRNFSGNY